jgi:hypothetical protein
LIVILSSLVKQGLTLFVSKNFNLGYNFWLVSARAFIFYMCIPSGKTLHLILWPWPTDLWRWSLKPLAGPFWLSQSSSYVLSLCCPQFEPLVKFSLTLFKRWILYTWQNERSMLKRFSHKGRAKINVATIEIGHGGGCIV